MARTYEERLRDAKAAAVAAAGEGKREREQHAEMLASPVRFFIGQDHQGTSKGSIPIVDTTLPYSAREFHVMCWCDGVVAAAMILDALNTRWPEDKRGKR